jgi:hypothetical protein
MRVYIDTADWWVGLYRGPNHYYVCLLPCVVIRWARAAPNSTEGRLSAHAYATDPLRPVGAL